MKPLNFPRLINGGEWEGYEMHDVRRFLKPINKWLVFNNWMRGKTGGITKAGDFCVYKHDFERFLNHAGISIGSL